MVNFNDNHSTSYELQGQWVKNVLEELQAKYHFKKVNIEAHPWETWQLCISSC